jgi:hypothetical protein
MTKVSSFIERAVIGAKQHRETHVQESLINFLIGHFTGRINVFANPGKLGHWTLQDREFLNVPSVENEQNDI